jgi:hypothetical protein
VYIFFEDLLARIISVPLSKWCSHITSSRVCHVFITMYGELKIIWNYSQWHTFRKKFCEKKGQLVEELKVGKQTHEQAAW